MDDMNDRSSGQGGNGGPSAEVVKGLLAIIFGVIFMVLAYKVIVAVLLLFSGLILLYYGMIILKITWVTKSVDNIIQRIRGILRL